MFYILELKFYENLYFFFVIIKWTGVHAQRLLIAVLYQILHVWMAHARKTLKINNSYIKTCLKTKQKKF